MAYRRCNFGLDLAFGQEIRLLPDAVRSALLQTSMVRAKGPAPRKVVMYPYISRVLAEQHTRDLQNEATRAHRARQARLVQRTIEDTQCRAGCWRLR
jgi:hypothetical protein